MTVIVYSLPGCLQCHYTKEYLESKGVSFQEIDVSQDASAREALACNGISQMPYVVVDDETWTGYRRDRMRELFAS